MPGTANVYTYIYFEVFAYISIISIVVVRLDCQSTGSGCVLVCCTIPATWFRRQIAVSRKQVSYERHGRRLSCALRASKMSKRVDLAWICVK